MEMAYGPEFADLCSRSSKEACGAGGGGEGGISFAAPSKRRGEGSVGGGELNPDAEQRQGGERWDGGVAGGTHWLSGLTHPQDTPRPRVHLYR